MARLDAMLRHLVAQRGSDLHLACGAPPRVRLNGALSPIPNAAVLDDLEVGRLLVEITPPETWRTYTASHDADFAYALPGVGRFRVNLYKQVSGRGAVLRTIPEEVVRLEELRLPQSVDSLAQLRDGLVLVTGPTGSGKSTTLAALVDRINRTSARHIVTIEDPLEFVHQDRMSFFSHREVGRHTGSFAAALRAAIRQDADVLLVGELRDPETMMLALTAAEMGLLVFGTLHTNSAIKTIDRLLDAFPAAQQPQVRLTLSECLAGVVSQLLIRSVDGRSRVAAAEVLVRTPALGNIIRENNLSLLYSLMQAGRAQGMITMDQSLQLLMSQGLITREDALLRALDKAVFEKGGPAPAPAAPAAGLQPLPAVPGGTPAPPKR